MPEFTSFYIYETGKLFTHLVCQADETSPKYVVCLAKAKKSLVPGVEVDVEPAKGSPRHPSRKDGAIVAGLSKAVAV